MNGQLTIFSNATAYNTFKNSNNYTEPNVSIIGSNGVKYNTNFYPPKFLDILYSDEFGMLSYTSEVLPTSAEKIPIALCVVPTRFFGANQPARWMSLKYMNYSTPNTGSTSKQDIYWGGARRSSSTHTDNGLWGYCANDPLLTFNSYDDYNDYHTFVEICCDNPYYNSDNHTFSYDIGVISSDYYERADSQMYWHGTNSSDPRPYVSLYDAQGKWNKYPNIYISGEINAGPLSMQGGAYGDINGKQNTETILTYATAQSNWRTASKITNNSGNNYAPAACCCWRYCPSGTSQGDWYLPAAGEMAMVMTNVGQIVQKLYQISAVYPNYCINFNSYNTFHTSTERPEKYFSNSDYFNVYYGGTGSQRYQGQYSSYYTYYGYISHTARDDKQVLAMLSYDFL